jgi:hypothetical protein
MPRADRSDDYWSTDFECPIPACRNVDFRLHLPPAVIAAGSSCILFQGRELPSLVFTDDLYRSLIELPHAHA